MDPRREAWTIRISFFTSAMLFGHKNMFMLVNRKEGPNLLSNTNWSSGTKAMGRKVVHGLGLGLWDNVFFLG